MSAESAAAAVTEPAVPEESAADAQWSVASAEIVAVGTEPAVPE